ncbi:MAG TPA: hypothetical protein VMQ11_20025 [Alphaproteobacteria bacterium]|nr:hypothetical protein [Alphaproteobacteria bacterium]
MLSQDLSSDLHAPDGWRRAVWVGLLVATTVAFSFGLSCACPFAGLGAAAAMTMRGRDALLLTLAAWAANQAIGFGLLGYPEDTSTLTWGAVLGVVAVLSTLAAQRMVPALRRQHGLVVAAGAFLAAFVVYEGALYIAAAGALGGVEDFAPDIMGQIFTINAAAFVGLLVMSSLGSLAGLVAKPRLGLPAAG